MGSWQVYQLNVHATRILAHSDTEVPERVRPTVPSEDGETNTLNNDTAVHGSAAMAATAAFNGFSTTVRTSPPAANQSPVCVDASERKPKKAKKPVNAKASSSMEVDV